MNIHTFDFQLPIFDPLAKNAILRWLDAAKRVDHEAVQVHARELLRLKNIPLGQNETVVYSCVHDLLASPRTPVYLTFKVEVEDGK